MAEDGVEAGEDKRGVRRGVPELPRPRRRQAPRAVLGFFGGGGENSHLYQPQREILVDEGGHTRGAALYHIE